MRLAEQHAIGLMLGHLHYMSSRATDAERVLFLEAAANGNASMRQLTHNALMLSLMTTQDRESLLLKSGGRIMTSEYPLLGTPPYAELHQRLIVLNRSIARRSTITGGGTHRASVRPGWRIPIPP